MDGRDGIKQRVAQVLGGGDKTFDWLRSLDSKTAGAALKMLGTMTGHDLTEMAGILDEWHRLHADVVDSILVFAPFGWAPVGRADAALYRTALDVYHQTGKIESAEEIITIGWNVNNRLIFAVSPIFGIGAGDDHLTEIAHARGSLIERALKHHNDGAFEASVPIVLAQIDGIVRDLGVKTGFFENSSAMRSGLADSMSLLGLPESFHPLQKQFGAVIRRSETGGSLSRHAILHGRELGYDTIENSTKSIVLLAAVIEWALPRSRAQAEERHRKQEEKNTGSRDRDDNGRWLDRRGFDQAKEDLNLISLWQRVVRSTSGQYSTGILSNLQMKSGQKLNHPDRIQLRVSEDGHTYFAWCTTESGYVLGEASSETIEKYWHFAGEADPVGGPEKDSGWRCTRTDPAHPDW